MHTYREQGLELNGPRRLSVVPLPGEPAIDPDGLRELLRDLSGIASRGGFSSGTAPAELAVVRVGAERTTVFADLRCSGLDARFVNCVISALAVNDPDETVDTVVLAAPSGGPPPVVPQPHEIEEDTVYPERRDTLAFRLMIDTTVTSRLRRLVVTYPHAVTRDDLARLGDWIGPWAAALEAGAFVLPHEAPAEAVNVHAGVQLFEKDSAEIVVDRFDSYDEAFDILLNMLDQYSRMVDRIDKVELF